MSWKLFFFMINKSFIYLFASQYKMWFQESLQTDFVQWILEKNCWILLYLEDVFPLQAIHFLFDHPHRQQSNFDAPYLYVNCIIFTLISYSYNHRSRRMPSKYCFEKFDPVIFPCVDCTIIIFSADWRLQYIWSNQHFLSAFLAISWIFDFFIVLLELNIDSQFLVILCSNIVLANSSSVFINKSIVDNLSLRMSSVFPLGMDQIMTWILKLIGYWLNLEQVLHRPYKLIQSRWLILL